MGQGRAPLTSGRSPAAQNKGIPRHSSELAKPAGVCRAAQVRPPAREHDFTRRRGLQLGAGASLSRTAAGENWGGSRLPTPERAAPPGRGRGPQAALSAGPTPPRWRPAGPAPQCHLSPVRSCSAQNFSSSYPPLPARGSEEQRSDAADVPGPAQSPPHRGHHDPLNSPQQTPRSPSHPGLPGAPASPPSRAAGPHRGPSGARSTLSRAVPPSPWTPPVPPNSLSPWLFRQVTFAEGR